jgi:hypothetical protein
VKTLETTVWLWTCKGWSFIRNVGFIISDVQIGSYGWLTKLVSLLDLVTHTHTYIRYINKHTCAFIHNWYEYVLTHRDTHTHTHTHTHTNIYIYIYIYALVHTYSYAEIRNKIHRPNLWILVDWPIDPICAAETHMCSILSGFHASIMSGLHYSHYVCTLLHNLIQLVHIQSSVISSR